jgi:hypothetical protein
VSFLIFSWDVPDVYARVSCSERPLAPDPGANTTAKSQPGPGSQVDHQPGPGSVDHQPGNTHAESPVRINPGPVAAASTPAPDNTRLVVPDHNLAIADSGIILSEPAANIPDLGIAPNDGITPNDGDAIFNGALDGARLTTPSDMNTEERSGAPDDAKATEKQGCVSSISHMDEHIPMRYQVF